MRTIVAPLVLWVSVTGCHATPSASDPGSGPPRVEPVASADAHPLPPKPARTDGGIVRIAAGAWPLSNSHMFGGRTYDVRVVGHEVQARLHDTVSFQGYGMRPEDMSPARHTCTAWESLPDATAAKLRAELPSSADDVLECGETGSACDDLRAWYTSTAKPVQQTEDPGQIVATERLSTAYGRGSGACKD